jgi:hypothetical protein
MARLKNFHVLLRSREDALRFVEAAKGKIDCSRIVGYDPLFVGFYFPACAKIENNVWTHWGSKGRRLNFDRLIKRLEEE